ncbi:hypothetical protein TMatcc_007852 [Talaromyces marneffei ATCC 18224]
MKSGQHWRLQRGHWQVHTREGWRRQHHPVLVAALHRMTKGEIPSRLIRGSSQASHQKPM